MLEEVVRLRFEGFSCVEVSVRVGGLVVLKLEDSLVDRSQSHCGVLFTRNGNRHGLSGARSDRSRRLDRNLQFIGSPLHHHRRKAVTGEKRNVEFLDLPEEHGADVHIGQKPLLDRQIHRRCVVHGIEPPVTHHAVALDGNQHSPVERSLEQHLGSVTRRIALLIEHDVDSRFGINLEGRDVGGPPAV